MARREISDESRLVKVGLKKREERERERERLEYIRSRSGLVWSGLVCMGSCLHCWTGLLHQNTNKEQTQQNCGVMRPAAQCRVVRQATKSNNDNNGLTLTLTAHSHLHFTLNHHQHHGDVGDVGGGGRVRSQCDSVTPWCPDCTVICSVLTAPPAPQPTDLYYCGAAQLSVSTTLAGAGGDSDCDNLRDKTHLGDLHSPEPW